MGYAMSELGAGPTDTTAVLRQRIENLERILAAVLRTRTDARATVGAGPPTSPPVIANPVDGFLYVDTTNLRLYVRAAGQWRFLGPMT